VAVMPAATTELGHGSSGDHVHRPTPSVARDDPRRLGAQPDGPTSHINIGAAYRVVTPTVNPITLLTSAGLSASAPTGELDHGGS
jgi:hypothetical protein